MLVPASAKAVTVLFLKKHAPHNRDRFPLSGRYGDVDNASLAGRHRCCQALLRRIRRSAQPPVQHEAVLFSHSAAMPRWPPRNNDKSSEKRSDPFRETRKKVVFPQPGSRQVTVPVSGSPMRLCFGRAFLLKKGLPCRWESTCPIVRKRAQTGDNPVAGYVLCAPLVKTPCRTKEHSGKLPLQAGGRLERLEFFRLPPVCRLPCRNDTGQGKFFMNLTVFLLLCAILPCRSGFAHRTLKENVSRQKRGP